MESTPEHIEGVKSATPNLVEAATIHPLSLGETHVDTSCVTYSSVDTVECRDNIGESVNVLAKDDGDTLPGCKLEQDVNNDIGEGLKEEAEGISVNNTIPTPVVAPESTTKKMQNCPDPDTRVQETLKTIATYKALAKNKGAHQMILKEAVLIGQLVLCLGDESPQVIDAAFEVVKILYNNRNNHVALKNSLHFLEALIVVSRTEGLSPKVREDARKMYDIVKSAKTPLSQSNDANNTNSISEACPEAQSKQKTVPSGNTTSEPNRSRNNDRKTVISLNPAVFVQEHKYKLQRITGAVVKVKGIVSVTYDFKRHFCIIRAKSHVPPEVFGKTIANLGFECYLVRRNELKEEVKIKMEADAKLENNLSALEQENIPSYLPDDDEDENVSRNDMVARGDEPEGTSVTGKIQNFFRRSFFW